MESHRSHRRIGGALILVSVLFNHASQAGVGRTPGAPTVTADGEAAYSIPLALPPGTAGLTPVLSLEYRHRAPGGLLGIGWGIGGLSQIARCPRTIAQDGISAPVSASADDRFCLDGRRLVVVNGVAYGAPGAEYRTEIESYARIRHYTGTGAGPQYFVVEAANGRILEYGATPDSRQDGGVNTANFARIWALNRIRDRSGNVIDFQYVEDAANADFYISAVRYNSNPAAGLAPTHEVSFVYEDRPSNEVDSGYVAGSPIRRVKRLIRIDVTHQSTIVRRYELGYEPALAVGGRSRLASLRECGAGGSDCLAPTIFTWRNGVAGLAGESSISAPSPGSGGFSPWTMFNSMDINGDGRSDLVWAGGATVSGSTVRFRLAQPDGGFAAEVNTGVPSAAGVGAPFDRDGDGRMDLLRIDATGRWSVLPGAATGFGPPIPVASVDATQLMDYRGADINGDGLGDIVYSEVFGYTDNSLVVRARLALPSGGYSAMPITLYEQATAIGYDRPEGGRFIGRAGDRIDLDGDGAEDLLLDETYTIARISTSGWATDYFDGSFAGIQPVDLNDDGCTDLVYVHYTNRLRARFGVCAIYRTGPELQGPPSTTGILLVPVDWNSDGRGDVLWRDATNWQVVTFSGDSFAASVNTGVPHYGATAPFVVDVNGDGLDDLVSRIAGQARVRLHAGERGDLLESAVDGFGVTAAFAYRPLTDAAVYARGEGAMHPVQDVQSAAYVVSVLSTTDGSGAGTLLDTRYRYEQLRRDLSGRGSLGFAKRFITDPAPDRAMQVEETRHQAFPLTGLPERIVVRRLTGAVIDDTQIDWRPMELGNAGARRWFPHVSSATHRQYELSGTYAGAEILATTRTVGAIDPVSGLATDVTTTTTEIAGGMSPGSSATRRVLHTSVLNDTANWCLGRSLATQATASHTLSGGAAITRTTDMAWDGPKCRPTQQRAEPGSAQWQAARALAYDAVGNLSRSEISGAGVAPRATTVGWDARGRFPVSVSNPLSQVTNFTWDPATGDALTMTDPNTLALAWTYDAFGESAGELRPDGTSTVVTRAACTTGCDPRARVKVTRQERDSLGVVHATVTLELDQLGRAVRSTLPRPGGGKAVLLSESDARGRLAREYLPFWDGGTPPGYWQYEYDALDRLVGMSLRSAAGSIERAVAVRHDGLTQVWTDPRGQSTSLTSSALGAIVNVTDPAGGSTLYEYDAFGRPLRVRDATGAELSTASYNVRGMLLAQTDADLGSWTYSPDALGEITSVRDPRGQVVQFAHDALGRLTSRIAPDGTRTWTWGTSASARNIGTLAAISAPGYGESYAYDSFGRPATHTINADTSYRYDYAYNPLGLLDTLTYPGTLSGGRFRIRHEYDGGALVRISDADAPGTTFWRLNTEDAAGNVIDESLGAGVRIVTGFSPVTGEPEYRQAGAGGGSEIQNLAWGWDANGNLASRQDLTRGITEDFRYDALDRLDDSRRNGIVNLDLSYDGIGNITWKSDVCPTPAPCFGYDATHRHAVTSAGGISYVYDAAGNMTRRGGAAIAWDSANRPTSIANPDGNNSRFWYGPDGNRWKQVSSQSGTAETTIYAGGLMEKVSRGRLMTWRHYVVAPTGTAAVHLRYTGGSAARTRYLTHDHQGSTDHLLDSAGKVVVAESFGAFGARRGPNWTGTPSATELAAIDNATNDGFTGHEHLEHLDLVHMGGRVYDPRLGRFLSADPLIPAAYDGQSLNRYAYAWNNPLTFTDPDGYTPCVTAPNGNCARVTVIGLRRPAAFFVGGAGWSQVESARERDPCGRESDGTTCAMQAAMGFAQIDFVLSVGNQADPTLSRGPTADFLQGAAARFGNMTISSSPVTWLFGADSDFEWFEIPDSSAGRSGSKLGTAGVFVGGSYRSIKALGAWALSKSPRLYAKWEQLLRGYAMDRWRNISLKQDTLLYGALPGGKSPFFTTSSGFRRSGGSSAFLHDRLQMIISKTHGMRTRFGAYRVLEDVDAAFGRAIRNTDLGPGGLPQVAVPSFETSLEFLYDIPLRF